MYRMYLMIELSVFRMFVDSLKKALLMLYPAYKLRCHAARCCLALGLVWLFWVCMGAVTVHKTFKFHGEIGPCSSSSRLIIFCEHANSSWTYDSLGGEPGNML